MKTKVTKSLSKSLSGFCSRNHFVYYFSRIHSHIADLFFLNLIPDSRIYQQIDVPISFCEFQLAGRKLPNHLGSL